MPTARTPIQQIIVYTVVAAVLIAAVIAVIFWAKNRSEQYAGTDETEQVVEENGQTDGTSQDELYSEGDDPVVVEDDPEDSDQPSVIVGGTNDTPTSVPSAGPGDYILPVVALSAVVFAAIKYAQARRRLFSGV